MSVLPPDAALRLAAIVESSDDAIISKNLDSVITSWNHGAERLFGYPAAEAIGRSIHIVIPEERLGEEHMVLTNIRAGRRVEHFDTIRRRKDGTLVDVSLTISPIRDESGVIVGASKIARNITERKRFESQLADLQRRLLVVATASASIFGSTDADTVLARSIDLARSVFAADGYALWRAEGGHWRTVRAVGVSEWFAARVLAPQGPYSDEQQVVFTEPLAVEDVETSPAVTARLDDYRREGIRSMIAFPLLLHGFRSGTLVFYSRTQRAYPDIDLQVGTAIANITAAALTTAELYDTQRRGREQADVARHRAAFLAEAGAVLAGSLDYQATLRAVARLAVPTIADWCAVDIRGERGALQRVAVEHVDPDKVEYARSLQERYPADPEMPGGVHEVMRTGKPAFMTRIPKALIEATARDEEHRRIIESLELTSYMCVPLLAQGKAFGALTFVSAESGREYGQADLEFAQELATRAALAVQNAQSYARANEASRIKDEFLATLSHELRTPLNAVLGYARMLRMGVVDAERTRAAIEAIERNATALKQIIEDVLDISRIVAGRLRLNVEPVDLPSILRESAGTVMPAADAKGVRVEIVLDPLTTPVFGDPERLQQIIWNLMSNAIKFTPRGGRVQLRLSRVNSHVEIAVSDTGRGIDPSFLPYVFERFRQADATLSREHGGLGLGLAIARQLAELHGGTITVASDGLERGATFTVSLPLMIVQASTAMERREQPHTDRRLPTVSAAPRLDDVRVLAVDDERDSLMLLKNVLGDAGASVVTSASGPEALELLRTQLPDVIIADIGMPGMDGLEFIRRVREMEEPVRSTPATALTAYARSQDRITSLASGFQMHLVKPIDPLELIVAVSMLNTRRSST